jgi:hypothetical protein
MDAPGAVERAGEAIGHGRPDHVFALQVRSGQHGGCLLGVRRDESVGIARRPGGIDLVEDRSYGTVIAGVRWVAGHDHPFG